MLQLTRIHIKNFRSFKDATFELKDIQLLIGPNNSGKTNLLRVFEFLRMVNNYKELRKIDLKKIRYQHKEFHQALNNFPDPIEITSELFDSEKKIYIYYKIELFYLSQDSSRFCGFIGIASDSLSKEKFQSFNTQNIQDQMHLFGEAFIQRSGTIYIKDDSLIKNEFKVGSIQNTQSYSLLYRENMFEAPNVMGNTNVNGFLSAYVNLVELRFAMNETYDFFNRLIIYKPDTFFIKQPIEKFQADKSITGNCDNIASYLENLQSSDPDKFQHINKELSKSLSDFKGYNFDTVNSKMDSGEYGTVRYFRLKDRYDVNHLAEDISEGALYFLMLIAIINQKDIPPILMLEEPETGIHPRRISEIMEYLFILKEKHPEISIILTTHHPYVVDHFSDMPDRVWVFDTEKGETMMKNLQRDIIEPMNKKIQEEDMEPIDFSSSLGEHWALGFLGGVPKPVVRQ